jgi:hypothetical protein
VFPRYFAGDADFRSIAGRQKSVSKPTKVADCAPPIHSTVLTRRSRAGVQELQVSRVRAAVSAFHYVQKPGKLAGFGGGAELADCPGVSHPKTVTVRPIT